MQLVNTAQLAERFGVCQRTIRNWIQKKKIQPLPLSKKPLVFDLDQLLEQLGQPGQKEKPARS